jgi:hypothetical protein
MTKAPTAIRLAREGILPTELSHMPLPSFGERAACRRSDPEVFFSDRVGDIAAAKSICYSCPLIQNCAQWAIRFEEFGVFGGLSAKERHLLRGAKPPLNPMEQEIALQEVAYILGAPAKVVAARFGVEPRTVVRWRKLLSPMKEVI